MLSTLFYDVLTHFFLEKTYNLVIWNIERFAFAHNVFNCIIKKIKIIR